jgi:hypothetical protein
MNLVDFVTSDGKRKVCNARCYNARHNECVCICRGANHGRGMRQAQKLTTKFAAKWLRRAQTEDRLAHSKPESNQIELMTH